MSMTVEADFDLNYEIDTRVGPMFREL